MSSEMLYTLLKNVLQNIGIRISIYHTKSNDHNLEKFF